MKGTHREQEYFRQRKQQMFKGQGRVWHFLRMDSNAGRDWGQEEKGTTEDEMAGWHH